MSNDTLYSQIYNELVGGMHLEGTPFQLIGTPMDFVFSVAPTGQINPRAYQIVSGMPQWSPIGNYSTKDATLFDAVRAVLTHVTFKVSPEMQRDLASLQNDVTSKSNAVVQANSNMNQAYLSSKQNGGVIFAAKYPDISAWINNAPEAAVYNQQVINASAALQRSQDLLLEMQKASMPAELQRAVDAMKLPDGDPASTIPPRGWTKVPAGDGSLQFQPDWAIGTDGSTWRAALTEGTQGGFTIDLSQSDQSARIDKSWAGGSAGIQTPFWGIGGSGGWQKSDMFDQDSSVKVKITVQSSTRVPVTPGAWYPGGFLADLAAGAQGTAGQGYVIVSPWVASGGPGSSSLFGQHGIAGTRVAELIVVYKPSFEITMSANTYQQNKQKFEASGGLRIGPFTFGGSGGHESEFTRSTAKANTFSGASTSEDPLIIGVIVGFPGANAA